MTGIYVNPKTSKGTIDTDYAIVWLDQELTQLRVSASAMPKALGLVRVTRSNLQKTSRGIRVHAEDFEESFKLLKPASEVPKHVKILFMAKLNPTPVGVSQDELRKWLEQAKLQAKPIKPLGRQTWLLGFAKKTDEQWWTWNGQLMMLTFLPTRDAQNAKPVVASAAVKPEKHTQPSTASEPIVDAWADYRLKQGLPMPTQTAAKSTGLAGNSNQPVRVTEGPIEHRFQQQDQAIESLKQAMGAIQSSVEATNQRQDEMATKVEQKFNNMERDMSVQLSKLGSTFEATVTAAMRKQDKQLSDSFQELKEMMLASANANAPKKQKTTPREGPGNEGDGEL